MKSIPTGDVDRLLFRDDWGWFWRAIGWFVAAFGILYTIGICLPVTPKSQASTQPAGPTTAAQATPAAEKNESPGVFLAVMIFALAGWALYRRRILLDRRQGIIAIRCGVGLLAWSRQRQMDEFDRIVVRRRESRSDTSVYYRVIACGKRESLRIATIDKDALFDSAGEARSFSRVVAEFCGYQRTEQGIAQNDCDAE